MSIGKKFGTNAISHRYQIQILLNHGALSGKETKTTIW